MEISEKQHPFEFVLNRLITPRGLTQAEIQKALNVGAKTISELYNKKRGLSPLMAAKLGKYFSIAPELLMQMHVEYELEKTHLTHKKEISAIEPFIPEKQQQTAIRTEKPDSGKTMLLSTINNSMGNKARHYTVKDLQNLFYTKRFTAKKKYALRILFSEATVRELVIFIKQREIPPDNVRALYHYYKSTLKGESNARIEWLLK
ncbi:MAG: helix-turn-helix domain-containing protein [Proteobacteria bacterium]|nr:helix-turn-helix domain-containing protein [Pseudomonadota bacterium]